MAAVTVVALSAALARAATGAPAGADSLRSTASGRRAADSVQYEVPEFVDLPEDSLANVKHDMLSVCLVLSLFVSIWLNKSRFK